MSKDELEAFLKKKESLKKNQVTDDLGEFLKKKESATTLEEFLELKDTYPVSPEEFVVKEIPEKMQLRLPEELKPGAKILPIERELTREPRLRKGTTIRAAKPKERKEAREKEVKYGAFEWPGKKPFFIEHIEPSKIEKALDVPGQFLTQGANTMLFGIPGRLHKEIWGEDLPTSKTTYGEIAAGGGSLVGMIGPGAAVAPFKLSGKAANLIFKGVPKTTAGKFLQGMGKSVVTLSLAEGAVEWEGDTAKDITLNKLKAMAQAAPTGAVFGAAPWLNLTAKYPILSSIFRIGAGSAAIDLIHGRTPWDDRTWQQKTYDYGLNVYFLRHGRRPEILTRLAKEGKAFNEEARRDGFEAMLPETPKTIITQKARPKGDYPFLPKNAPQIWRDVMDVTSGKGIRPFKDKITGKPVEYEEYAHNVPKPLKRKAGYPADEVADMLGLEDSHALYRELEYIKPTRTMTELEYWEDQAGYYEKEPVDIVVKNLERKYAERGGRRTLKPGLTIELEKKIKTRPVEFEDLEIEYRFQKAQGARKKPLPGRILYSLAQFKNMWTRTYKHLPNTAEFIEAKTALKTLEAQRGIAVDRSLKVINQFTRELDKTNYDIFRRKVILDDLSQEAEQGHPLPFGFTKDTLAREKGKIDSAVSQRPDIKEALADRNMLWEALRKSYVEKAKEAGIDVEDRFTRPDYFRHQVLEFAKARGVYGQKMEYPTRRGYLKRRTGSELDINTDYIQVEKEILSQMFYDVEIYKAMNRLKKGYDISDHLKKIAKEKGTDWHDEIPRGYVMWQPREGNVFYFTDTIPARIAKDILSGELSEIGITKDQLGKALAKGRKFKEWVIREEIGKTLDDISRLKPQPKFWEKALRGWKKWILVGNPRRAFKYNLRNLTGDADAAFCGNPSSFKKVPQSIREIIEVHIAGRPMSENYRDWYERGGMKATLQEQEMGELRRLTKDKAWEMPLKPFKAWWKVVRIGTDLRESVLRYANYLDYIEQIKVSPGARPRNFGASLPEEIMALKDPKDQAYRLSKELLGAYDEISVSGSTLRKYVYPFWSWQEINFRRYVRIFKNAAQEKGVSAAIGRKIIGTGLKAPYFAYRIGSFSLKAMAFRAAVETWNKLVFPDEEEKLPEQVKERSHIILGKDENGEIQAFSRVGALIDLLDWFDLDDFIDDAEELARGTTTLKDIALDSLKAPVSKAVSGLAPFYKWPVELATGLRFFPDVFEPRSVRNRIEIIARDLNIEHEYRELFKLPRRPYKETWEEAFLYKYDPMSTAYWDILGAKKDFSQKRGIKRARILKATPKSNALYHYWNAIRLEDETSAKIYWNKYMDYAKKDGELKGRSPVEIMKGFQRGVKQSINTKHPLYGLSELEQAGFFEYLKQRPELEGKYNLALNYWTLFFRSLIL